MKKENFGVYIGIDWSDKKHDIALKSVSEAKVEFEVVPHSPEALEAWVLKIKNRYPAQKIAICLEQSRGSLIYALMKHDCFTLFPINGSTLANYREAFRPSRGKDDPSDAEFLLDIIFTHQERLRAWEPEDEKTRKLQYLVEFRRKLVAERTRISNKLTDCLKSYFPQFLDWFDLKTTIACSFLQRWTTLEASQMSLDAELLKFFHENRARSSAKNNTRLTEIREAVPLINDKAVICSMSLMVKALARQMKEILDSVAEFDSSIDELYKSHKNSFIFSSFPGAGEVLAPRMLTAFGTNYEKFPTPQDASQYFGVAPLIERSGKQCWIRWRYFCPKFLRQTFHEFANESIKFSFWAKAYYAHARSIGKSHHVAIRALAFKWIRIIWKCWVDGVPYNEIKYLEKLKKKNSPLLIGYLQKA